jgi:hypothetical protein
MEGASRSNPLAPVLGAEVLLPVAGKRIESVFVCSFVIISL